MQHSFFNRFNRTYHVLSSFIKVIKIFLLVFIYEKKIDNCFHSIAYL